MITDAALIAEMSDRSQPASAGCFGVQIDALQRLAERADRFHRAADHDRLAVGHAAFEAAGVVGAADEAQRGRVLGGGVEADFIVHLASRAGGRLRIPGRIRRL